MANKIIANLTLDTYERNKIVPLVIPQHDYGARYIRVRITEQGRSVSVESGAVVSIIATRRGDGEEAAFSGSVNADGSVLVPVVQWMLDVPSDDVDCHVAVTGTGYQYSTTGFVIVPQERANPSALSEDDPRMNIVEEALIKVVEEANRAEEQADLAAENARAEVEQLVGELGVVQVLGTSPTSVVSQALTTTLYNRNSKRITNLEQGVADQFETDSSVAYVKDVPESALPYAEVKKVGGMTYKDGDTLKSALVTEVESVGANLFNLTHETMDNSRVNGVSNIVINDSNSITGKANLGDGQDYIVYGQRFPSGAYACRNTTSGVGRIIVCLFNENEENISANFTLVGLRYNEFYEGFFADGNEWNINIPSGVAYWRIGLFFGFVGTLYTISNIQVAKGTDVPYSPHQKHTLPIPAEVRPANGINENVYDYIEWAEDGSVKKTVKCGEEVDLGALDWTVVGGENYAYSMSIRNSVKQFGAILHSDLPTGIATMNIDSASAIVVIFNNETFTVNSLKAALSGMTLVYELATPEATDISDLLSEDNLIGVEGNGTITFKNAYEYAVPSEIEYQVGV